MGAEGASGRGGHFDEMALRLFEVWRELRRAGARRLIADFYGAGAVSLEPTQVDGLELLVTRPEWRMSELASSLHIDRSTATRLVDRLVAAGLAQRRRSVRDRRGIYVWATSQGRLRCGLIMRARQRAMVDYLRDFADDDVALLADLMERLICSLGRVGRDRAGEGDWCE
jgi:DNA-binding MarR family transcriptional regulator